MNPKTQYWGRPCKRGHWDRWESGMPWCRRNRLSQQCMECRCAGQARWAKKNPEKVRAFKARYYKEHSAEIVAYSARYYKEHSAKIVACVARWQKENPEKVRGYNTRFYEKNREERSAKARQGGSYWVTNRKRVLGQQRTAVLEQLQELRSHNV